MNLKIRLTTVTCIVSLLSVTWVYAASEDRISLTDAVRLTLDNNPQFRTYQLRSQAIAGEMQTADLKPAMRVSTEIENVLGTGDLNWFQGTELTLALSQVIEFGDKRLARINTVSQRQNLLMAEQRILELDMLSQTNTRYLELAAAEEIQELLIRATQLAAELFTVVSERVAAGRAPEAERARAAAALAVAELAEQSADFNTEAARLRLSSLWGILQPQFTGTQADIMQIETLPEIASLLEKLEENPAIQVFASETRLREAELREARSRRVANIEVGAGIRHLAQLNDTALMFQASMPLQTRRRSTGAITAAQANLLRVESERETAVLRMSTQLLTLHQQRQLAVNEFNTLQESVLPQLENALDATRTAFESGRYSYLELSAAQKELLDAELSQIEAAARAHLLRVEIERLSGEAFTEPTESTLGAFTGGISP